MPAVLTVLSFAFFSCSTSEKGQGEIIAKQDISDMHGLAASKVEIDICGNVIRAAEATELSLNFYSLFSTNAGTFHFGRFKINSSSLSSFEADIVNEHQALLDGGNHSCAQYFPAMQVYYGLVSGKLRFYYRKICFCSATTATGQPKRFDLTTLSNDYYAYEKTNFVKRNAEAVTARSSYSNEILIKESVTAGTRTFVAVNTAEGDANSVLVPLQLINAVLTQNNSNELSILNAAVSVSGVQNKIRHSLLLGPQSGLQDLTDALKVAKETKLKGDKMFILTPGFYGNMADRSNLCPPSCAQAVFTATTNLKCEQ